MNKSIQVRVQNEIDKIIKMASDVEIISNIPFNEMQLALLRELNYHAATQTLYDDEVERDPRKILYKTNQNLKKAVVALCLTQVLINKRSKGYYTKEYFEENIEVKTINVGLKQINFCRCEDDEILSAINEEKVFDWILYCQGRGINAFSQEKTDCRGVEGFVPGASSTYEFARFQNLHNEQQRRKNAIEKEKLQLEFKQTFMKELAAGLAKQQLEQNPNVMELVASVFEKENYTDAINKLLDNHLEQQKDVISEKITNFNNEPANLIEYHSNNYAENFVLFVNKQKQHQR